jgi:hypothetical protein
MNQKAAQLFLPVSPRISIKAGARYQSLVFVYSVFYEPPDPADGKNTVIKFTVFFYCLQDR